MYIRTFGGYMKDTQILIRINEDEKNYLKLLLEKYNKKFPYRQKSLSQFMISASFEKLRNELKG